MKTKFIVATMAALAFITTVNAQESDESRVKILPTAEPGVVMVLYAIETNDPVEVSFMTDDGVIATDKIKGGPYPKGLSKRYDIRKVNKKDLWIEISSPRITATYLLVRSKDKQTFTPYLKRTSYHHNVVASNN